MKDDRSAREKLWALGIVAPWYLRDDQLPLYELLRSKQFPFLECARRYGKTTAILCFVIEELLRNPGWICTWCEPDQNQAREIVKPEVEKIFNSAPMAIRPVWSTTDSFYWFPSTGRRPEQASQMKLRGVNHDKGNSARGPFANIVVADEFGYWRDPDYIVRSALEPLLQTTNGPLICASTPPPDLGHAYYSHATLALGQGRYIQRTIHDNKSLTTVRIQELMDRAGGENSPDWQREYLCNPVADPTRQVVPEYKADIHLVPDDYPRPASFDAYVGMDLGLNDSTAALFAYWDFKKAELVIEDEYVDNGRNTKEIVEACLAKELALWHYVENGEKKPIKPYRRVGDNEAQQLYDMQTIHKYYVEATAKDDKLAALNALRLRFSGAKIRIKQRCRSLAYQLKVGLWNERRTDYQRGEKTGHLDAIDALIYLSRNISEGKNPYPQNVGVAYHTHHVPDADSRGSENRSLREVFEPFAGGL